jgi:hypothetical protein
MPNMQIWGFHRLADIADERVVDNIEAVRDAVVEYLNRRQQDNQAVIESFAERTTQVQAKFKMPGQMRLQPSTELGRAIAQRYEEAEYTVAWPIQKAMLALGQTYEQRQKMTIGEFAGLMEAVGDADLQWLRDHVLAALFYSGSGWFHDDPDDPAGELTIVGLANNDSQQYFKAGASGYIATDNHYVAQAGDLVTASDPIPEDYEDLIEHPQNTGGVVVVGSALDRAKYTGLGQFYQAPDPNLSVGSGVTQFVGNEPGGQPLGEFIGYHMSGAYVYLWRGMPQNYYVMFTADGPKPLRQREHPETSLQGFGPEADREDFPYFETQYARRAGFGGWNRVGALVRQFNKADATYAIPANYNSPMP